MKLIFEKSIPGRGQDIFPACDVPVKMPAAPLREKAFVFSATLVSVPTNAIVKVIGESNGWIKFAYKGQSGWFRKTACVVNLGDVDGNGSANSSDALAILKAATGAAEFTDAQKQVADFNGDGSVNSVDALTVLQVTTGKLKFD